MFHPGCLHNEFIPIFRNHAENSQKTGLKNSNLIQPSMEEEFLERECFIGTYSPPSKQRQFPPPKLRMPASLPRSSLYQSPKIKRVFPAISVLCGKSISLEGGLEIEKKNDNVGFEGVSADHFIFVFSVISSPIFPMASFFFWNGTHLSFIARSLFRWQKKRNREGEVIEHPIVINKNRDRNVKES